MSSFSSWLRPRGDPGNVVLSRSRVQLPGSRYASRGRDIFVCFGLGGKGQKGVSAAEPAWVVSRGKGLLEERSEDNVSSTLFDGWEHFQSTLGGASMAEAGPALESSEDSAL